MKCGLCIAMVFLFLSILTFGQTIHIRVIDSHKGLQGNASVVVYKSISDTIDISAVTDDSGYCMLHVMPSYEYDVHVTKAGYRKKFVKNIDPLKDTSIVIDLYTPCRYESSRNDRTCPVCHKQDMTIPISYGKLDSTKETNDFYPGGCILTGCDPNWYCKRDSSKF